MSGFDYIRIRNLETSDSEINPGLYEIFQGIGGADAAGVLSETPISNDPELAEGIWQGQNEKLEHENEYCDQLQALFKKKQQRIDGWLDKLLDVVEEIIGNWLAKLAAGWVFFETGSLELGWLAGLLTEVGTEWGFDALRSLLTRGNQLLEGIKAENVQLLQIEKSRENYEYREQVLARHREDIKVILEQIRMAEKQVELNTQLEMKALLERLTDLALRDDTIELGDMRLHSRGRVVNF
jgi:hypothetical protein